MPRLIRFTLVPILLLSLLTSGCASSSGGGPTGNTPDIDNSTFSNFLVAALADNYTNRAQYERTVVSGLRANGASATAYYEAAGGNKPISREAIRELIAANGYDAVLLTRVVDSAAEVEVKQGSAAAKVTRRDNRPADFFRYDYVELNEPGRIEVRTEATLASELYRASDESMIWSTQITNSGADNVGEVIDEVAADVVKRLRRARHIAR